MFDVLLKLVKLYVCLSIMIYIYLLLVFGGGSVRFSCLW